MRLLYMPQLSMRNYRTNKYSILSDAQFTKCKGLLFSLVEQDKDIDVTLVLPERIHDTLTGTTTHTMNAAVKHFIDIFGEERRIDIFGRGMEETRESKLNILLEDKLFGPDVALSRFNFPWKAWFDMIRHCQPDIIINEIATLTPNFAMLRRYMKAEFKIATIFIHIKNEYVQYQACGYMQSDAVIFPSIAHKQRWDEYTSTIVPVNYHKGKTFIWPHCYCETEIQNARQAVGTNKEKILVFPSRFSDLKRTHSDSFCEIAKSLVNKFDDLYIYILNPNEALNAKGISSYGLDHPRIIIQTRPLPREQYIELLVKAEFGCILQALDKIPSISLVEMIATGMKVFLFRADIPFEYISLGKEFRIKRKSAEIERVTNTMIAGIEGYEFDRGLDEIFHKVQYYSAEFNTPDVNSNLRQILRS